jgi:phosphoribosylformylglycinamidine cyclo-ligase
VGIDLVAMSVNDVVVTGAEPLFFLDYFATGRLRADEAAQVVKGIAEGCRQAGCALIGGETAELPGFYAEGEYDLAGFAVGVVERDRILDGRSVRPGDALLGVASTGLHSNGYSLARKVLLERHALSDRPPELSGLTVGEALLEPTRIYAKDVLALLAEVPVGAVAHITGGGLPGNAPRNLPDGTRAVIREGTWKVPAIFELIEREGGVARDEMYRTFNMGLGLVVALPARSAEAARALLAGRGLASWVVGTVEAGSGEATCEVVR